mmetsp:Transcript_18937/g.71679  ORF Transcript_18937/g.71679 Transcript_18937/m.71679 type:complete len:257 (-) Transcript_18937:1127-1897(-)
MKVQHWHIQVLYDLLVARAEPLRRQAPLLRQADHQREADLPQRSDVPLVLRDGADGYLIRKEEGEVPLHVDLPVKVHRATGTRMHGFLHCHVVAQTWILPEALLHHGRTRAHVADRLLADGATLLVWSTGQSLLGVWSLGIRVVPKLELMIDRVLLLHGRGPVEHEALDKVAPDHLAPPDSRLRFRSQIHPLLAAVPEERRRIEDLQQLLLAEAGLLGEDGDDRYPSGPQRRMELLSGEEPLRVSVVEIKGHEVAR